MSQYECECERVCVSACVRLRPEFRVTHSVAETGWPSTEVNDDDNDDGGGGGGGASSRVSLSPGNSGGGQSAASFRRGRLKKRQGVGGPSSSAWVTAAPT